MGAAVLEVPVGAFRVKWMPTSSDLFSLSSVECSSFRFTAYQPGTRLLSWSLSTSIVVSIMYAISRHPDSTGNSLANAPRLYDELGSKQPPRQRLIPNLFRLENVLEQILSVSMVKCIPARRNVP